MMLYSLKLISIRSVVYTIASSSNILIGVCKCLQDTGKNERKCSYVWYAQPHRRKFFMLIQVEIREDLLSMVYTNRRLLIDDHKT